MRAFVAVFLILAVAAVGILVVLPVVSQALSGLLVGQTITRMGEAIKPTGDIIREQADTDFWADAPERARKPVDERRRPERVRTPPRDRTRSEKPRKADKQEREHPATPTRRELDPRLTDPDRAGRFERRIDRGVERASPGRMERKARQQHHNARPPARPASPRRRPRD